jgi:hypothetical protein
LLLAVHFHKEMTATTTKPNTTQAMRKSLSLVVMTTPNLPGFARLFFFFTLFAMITLRALMEK